MPNGVISDAVYGRSFTLWGNEVFLELQSSANSLFKFAFHSLQIREVIGELCGADRLPIWEKVIKSSTKIIHIT